MQSGYIAFLDVLGFREIVESKLKEEEQGKFGSSSAFFDRYLGTITEALDTGSGGLEPVDLIVFSDCILLVTDGGGEPALQSLLIRCSRISGLLLQKGIAVRGAIHCGPMLRKSMSAGVFAAGPAIIQAYDLEEEQNWTGIMLDPVVSDKLDLNALCSIPIQCSKEEFKNLRTPFAAFVQWCDSIPFHCCKKRAGFAVVPTTLKEHPSPKDVHESIGGSLKALRQLELNARRIKHKKKYGPAIEWLSTIQDKWHRVLAPYAEYLANPY